MKDKNKLIAIFGGTGNMGKVIAELAQKAGLETIIVDTQLSDSLTPAEAIQQAHLLYFSVYPLDVITNILNENKTLLSPDHIIIDNASLKSELIQIYNELDKQGVSICSTHPLVKHDTSWFKQKTLLMPVGAHAKQATQVAKRIYDQADMNMITMEIANHDSLMGFVQLFPHIIMRSVGHTLASLDIEIKTLTEISTANSRLFLLSMYRTVVQDPKISAKLISALKNEETNQHLIHRLETAFKELLTLDEVELTKTLQDDFDKLNSENIGTRINDITTVALERLANLEVQSIIIKSISDTPGLLIKILQPFEDYGVSLTAIDSHKKPNLLTFGIGIQPESASPEKLEKIKLALEQLGCEVVFPESGPISII